MEMAAGMFKMKCLKLMDEVRKNKSEIVITKHGKPVAKLVPFVRQKPKSPFGALKGSVAIHGDIISPIDVEWEANA
jgi:prevent-host-death family protein